MSDNTRRATRAARQQIETAQLLGVDFVPVRLEAGDDAPAAADVEPAATPTTPAPSSVPAPAPARTGAAASGASREEKAALLEALRLRHEAECPHCTEATAHTNLVFGDGDPDADLMFVGEAPGAEEDKQGIPFVGRSGKKLTEMIVAMGLSRETVYIANVLKSRPPNNATPTSSEAAKCGVYLQEQVSIIEPKVIVTLGKPAAQLLLGTREAMGRLRGTWHSYEGIPVMPTFHPAYLLRQYTPENRRKVWSDLQKAMSRLESV